MKIQDTFIDKKGIRRFYHRLHGKGGRISGERAFEIKCDECKQECVTRKRSLSLNHAYCSLKCQRVFLMREKEGHLNWKGGKYRGGQYDATMIKGHSRANRDGYVPDHLLEMENKIGRPIERSEKVHHIDMNKKNNDISNLYLCKDNSEHLKIHHQMNKLVVELMERGLVEFKDGKYAYITSE